MRHAQKFNYDVTCIQKPQSVFAVHTRTIDLHFSKAFSKTSVFDRLRVDDYI